MKAANKKMIISVANDFSKTPGPRIEDEGNYSGKRFREELLFPKILEAIREDCILEVNLDGTSGPGISFIEESFGGLIRVEGLSLADIRKVLRIISEEEDFLIDDINTYMEDAEDAKK